MLSSVHTIWIVCVFVLEVQFKIDHPAAGVMSEIEFVEPFCNQQRTVLKNVVML